MHFLNFRSIWVLVNAITNLSQKKRNPKRVIRQMIFIPLHAIALDIGPLNAIVIIRIVVMGPAATIRTVEAAVILTIATIDLFVTWQ